MTERLDLFPCPFCGVLPTLGVDPKDGLVYPFCDCIGADAEGSFVSVDIWQDRPAENALRAELAQARADLDALGKKCTQLEDDREYNAGLVAERDAELAALKAAAHMPDDYQFGLPSWINQRLYAAYIGAQFSPEVLAHIAAGRLTFPDAPVYKELAALRERQRWVKVSERLPEKRDAAYLCVMDAYTDHTPYISVRFFRLTGEWNDNHVTHWQPLPEPPEANDGG